MEKDLVTSISERIIRYYLYLNIFIGEAARLFSPAALKKLVYNRNDRSDSLSIIRLLIDLRCLNYGIGMVR